MEALRQEESNIFALKFHDRGVDTQILTVRLTHTHTPK